MKTIMEEFFERRFGKDHPHDSYFEEWKQRFVTGHPEKFMDTQSKIAYAQVLKEVKSEVDKMISEDEQAIMALGE